MHPYKDKISATLSSTFFISVMFTILGHAQSLYNSFDRSPSFAMTQLLNVRPVVKTVRSYDN